MTFEEYHEINRKYGCKIIPFDIDLNKFTKEEYEKLGIEVLEGYE